MHCPRMKNSRPTPMRLLTATFATTCVATLASHAFAGACPPAAIGCDPTITMTFLGRSINLGYDVGATEISAFDPDNNRIFSVNGLSGGIDVWDFSSPSLPIRTHTISLAPYGVGATSVAFVNGYIAAAVEATVRQDPGKVVFIKANTLDIVASVTVGALPDMICATPDGTKVLTANEGEPNAGYTANPNGSVSVIDITGGIPSVTQTNVTTVDFTGLAPSSIDPQIIAIGPAASLAADLEPEYIAISADSTKAFVTCQESNAMATLDLATLQFTQLKWLGVKDHSVAGNALDPSDADGGNLIANWPVFGMYQPDSIALLTVDGEPYILGANEGDAREYTAYVEAARVSTLALDSTVFPNAAALKANAALGKLNVTKSRGDIDGDGDYDALYSFGARSMAIWRPDGSLVWDSGDQFEQVTAVVSPTRFNSSNTNNTRDNRSDDKGPEPEAITTGVIAGRTYAFVGLERIGGIMAYDVSNPSAPEYQLYVNSRDFSVATNTTAAGDLGPEGAIFIPAATSPNGRNLVVVSNEISGTLSVWAVDPICETPGDLNADCVVDAADLADLLSGWGACGKGACTADIDGDGEVGAGDLATLLSNWG
jgi:2',3'-cyclic-nucleotide 2'-phosphodiesterase/3'-nucleotidase/5'-nucleotidase